MLKETLRVMREIQAQLVKAPMVEAASKSEGSAEAAQEDLQYKTQTHVVHEMRSISIPFIEFERVCEDFASCLQPVILDRVTQSAEQPFSTALPQETMTNAEREKESSSVSVQETQSNAETEGPKAPSSSAIEQKTQITPIKKMDLPKSPSSSASGQKTLGTPVKAKEASNPPSSSASGPMTPARGVTVYKCPNPPSSSPRVLKPGDLTVEVPLIIGPQKHFKEFDNWYKSRRRPGFDRVPGVGKACRPFFKTILDRDGWLTAQNVDAVVNMLLHRSKRCKDRWPAKWTSIETSGWNALTTKGEENPDEGYELIHKFIIGTWPSVVSVPWWAEAPIVSVGNVDNAHWFCYELRVADQTVVVYDSLSMSKSKEQIGRFFEPILARLAYFCSKAQLWEKITPKEEIKLSWDLVIYEHPPQQKNGNDCGIFALKFLECLLTGNDLGLIQQNHIATFRKQYCSSLYRAGIQSHKTWDEVIYDLV